MWTAILGMIILFPVLGSMITTTIIFALLIRRPTETSSLTAVSAFERH